MSEIFPTFELTNWLVNLKLMNKDITRDRILEVATEIFYQKGLAGARMQEIGDAAEVNKAMLHYYFKTKEQLFETVFQRALDEFLDGLHRVFSAPQPLKQKISAYVDYTIDSLQANPSVVVFILHELNQRPERLTELFASPIEAHITDFREQWRAEFSPPSAADTSADHLFTDMVSLCIYPFLAKPLLQSLLGKNDQVYAAFLRSRRETIKQRLLTPE